MTPPPTLSQRLLDLAEVNYAEPAEPVEAEPAAPSEVEAEAEPFPPSRPSRPGDPVRAVPPRLREPEPEPAPEPEPIDLTPDPAAPWMTFAAEQVQAARAEPAVPTRAIRTGRIRRAAAAGADAGAPARATGRADSTGIDNAGFAGRVSGAGSNDPPGSASGGEHSGACSPLPTPPRRAATSLGRPPYGPRRRGASCPSPSGCSAPRWRRPPPPTSAATWSWRPGTRHRRSCRHRPTARRPRPPPPPGPRPPRRPPGRSRTQRPMPARDGARRSTGARPSWRSAWCSPG